jgi:type VI secretion system protein ImpA
MPLDLQALLRPLSAEAPCGADLDSGDSADAFLKYRIFGSRVRLETRFEKNLGPDVNWREVRELADRILGQSKDFRVLAHLAASVLRLEGLEALTVTLEAAAGWLETYWDSVYPRLDGDFAARCNALSGFADRMAIVDAVRRQPFLTHQGLGSCTYRDIEIAHGAVSPEASEEPIDPAVVLGLIQSVPLEDLTARQATLSRAGAALQALEERMVKATEARMVPDLAPLATLFDKMRQTLQKEIAPRLAAAPPAQTATAGAENGAGSASGALVPDNKGGTVVSIGSISSRQDALRALDAVGEFFRRNEPSSPVPLFVDRVKRLITMDFIQLLEDIVPKAVEDAKAAAGVPKPAE